MGMRILASCCALVLSLVVSFGAAADWQSGQDAYNAGKFDEAREAWLPLDEAGDAQAQAALGSLYIHGEGVPRDAATALMWTRRAAEQDDLTGQFNMGTFYAGGLGVPQDYATAAEWFRRAALRDDPHSRYNLGLMYSRGLGVVRDDVEAVFWLNTAAIIAGDPGKQLGELAESSERISYSIMMTMPREDVDAAVARSKAWETEYVGRYLRDWFSKPRETTTVPDKVDP